MSFLASDFHIFNLPSSLKKTSKILIKYLVLEHFMSFILSYFFDTYILGFLRIMYFQKELFMSFLASHFVAFYFFPQEQLLRFLRIMYFLKEISKFHEFSCFSFSSFLIFFLKTTFRIFIKYVFFERTCTSFLVSYFLAFYFFSFFI